MIPEDGNINQSAPFMVGGSQTNTTSNALNNSQPTNNKKTKKSGNLMLIGVICLTIAAICGIAFGVWAMMDGNAKMAKKDEQIADLRNQLEDAKTDNGIASGDGANNPDSNSVSMSDLRLINTISPERRYYLGITELDQKKDSREMDVYLIDTTKLGTEEGVVKYDIKTVLDKITDERVASLPDTLAEGTTNARPKSSCKSFKVRVGDVNWNPKNINWVYGKDWNDLLPFTVYTECIVDDGNVTSQSLGTSMYILNPQTGEYSLAIDEW